MNVAARAEVLAGARDDDCLNLRHLPEAAKRFHQFSIRIEGQGILSFGAGERDDSNFAFHLPLKVARANV
jgi:hypothetical protein